MNRPYAQYKEGRLKRIFGVLLMPGHAAADTPDNRTMPAHQHRKRGFVPMLDEVIQKLGIRQFRAARTAASQSWWTALSRGFAAMSVVL